MTERKAIPLFIGDMLQHQAERDVKGEFVSLLGDKFYKIENYDGMAPFFMSIVSSSNHWLFISSTGGLSAGRVSAEHALFPYYTDDRITENNENTGSKSIFIVTRDESRYLWEPFSDRYKGSYQIQRNLYKNIPGTALVFEEINFSLGLSFRYAWRTGDSFGFIKSAWLVNSSDAACQVEILDGIQNILPANITSLTQNTFSQLLDAYKRSELDPETGLAIFALNSTLTDLAEPSESLLATTVMQLGLDDADYLLASTQLENFRSGRGIEPETEVRGRRCAHFAHATLEMTAGAEKSWHLVADVDQDSLNIVSLKNKLSKHRSELIQTVERDIATNNENLEKIVASADGLQVSNDPLCTTHHFANVMFNVMRGGIFSNGYQIHIQDFIDFVRVRNHSVLVEHQAFFNSLPAQMNVPDLHARAESTAQADLIRLAYSYLPITFSRRHGDPSRPWNRFAIDIKKPDGSPKLGYEGNWRDIFQNWEALAYSYPEYVESMICTFLNATTVDGYNPYRITREGIDWEVPEPNNPWANIGYWSDHQIIYLQKLMEISAKVHPAKLQSFLSQEIFSSANVPYRIKRYEELKTNPFNSIEFSWDLERKITAATKEQGTDARLVHTREGKVLHSTLTEKLLTLLLAKLVNFVPEGGIWMNTQRPEWNDANNALVGKGLSVVTLCYLRRMIVFCKELLRQSELTSAQVSAETRKLFSQILQILKRFEGNLANNFTDEQRRAMMDALGQAGSNYRWRYYSDGLSDETVKLQISEILAFLDLAQGYVEHSLRANKRRDNLYHAYNILHLSHGNARVDHLYEMLEGQAAILSCGMLSGEESLSLLESLRDSKLYRADQHSYILYPDKNLPGFLAKNTITPDQVSGLGLVSELVKANNKTLIVRDEDGNYHFASQLRNIKGVEQALQTLSNDYSQLVQQESDHIRILFEDTFRHNEFTGRSGTFFAYEGLGSIYWHMVSKLLLAVQETILRTRNEASSAALIEKYVDIRRGLSFNKSPDIYGTFPTDPYSHTPKGQGAKQPGMTGMVKEEILARQMELGFSVENGIIIFDFLLFDKQEFLSNPASFAYWSVDGQKTFLELKAGSSAYSVCQVPIVLESADEPCIQVHFSNGNVRQISGHALDKEISQQILRRDGTVQRLVVSIP